MEIRRTRRVKSGVMKKRLRNRGKIRKEWKIRRIINGK
jgi:hypothetical protein